MFRTEKTVGMLKSIALIAGLAILLWSLGLPSLRFATAANLTSISDTITDSAPSASANHTISFVAPSGVSAGQTLTVTFPAGFTNINGVITEDDVDLEIDGTDEETDASASAGVWGVAISGQTITITSNDTTIGAASTTVIKIGSNATHDGTGANQIVNPASEGSYEISATAGSGADSGTTRVVILSSVEVTASVDTIFTFTVEGLGADVVFNGTATTTGAAGSTTIPFGTLTAGQATTTAQQLTVNTNASNGYAVTVQTDGPLESSAGGVIDGFNDSDTPTAWSSPTALINDPTTWGHWGITTDDIDMDSRTGDQFAAGEYIGASTTPYIVMEHDGPANGAGVGVGTTTIGFQVEISALQEAGEDYSTTLTYVATPTF